MAGDPRRVLGGDHLRWFNVMFAKEKISKEGDPRPVPLDDRGPPSPSSGRARKLKFFGIFSPRLVNGHSRLTTNRSASGVAERTSRNGYSSISCGLRPRATCWSKYSSKW